MSTDDSFEKFLSRSLSTSNHYVPDKGFTDRVMAALPKAHAPDRRWRQWAPLLAGLLIGLLVLSQLPVVDASQYLWSWLIASDPLSLLKAGAVASGTLLALCAAWLARQMEVI